MRIHEQTNEWSSSGGKRKQHTAMMKKKNKQAKSEMNEDKSFIWSLSVSTCLHRCCDGSIYSSSPCCRRRFFFLSLLLFCMMMLMQMLSDVMFAAYHFTHSDSAKLPSPRVNRNLNGRNDDRAMNAMKSIAKTCAYFWPKHIQKMACRYFSLKSYLSEMFRIRLPTDW